VDTTEHIDAQKKGRARRGDKTVAPRPQVPRRARVYLSVGTFAGLFCAEAMSSMRLYSLGEHAGYPPFLAWLLPGALDIYALTLVWFFSLLPAEHPLRPKAAREAALALGITVLCNALDEIVEAFARELPFWAPGVLFVLISALAPFVAYRLIHFRAEIGNDDANAKGAEIANTPAKNANRAPERQLAPQPPIDNETNANGNNPPAPNANGSGAGGANANGKGRSDEEWIAIAKPVYVRERDRLAKRPPEKAFWNALLDEVDRLTAEGVIPARDAPSLGTAKRVRDLVEAAFPELASRIHPVAS
jgi:hypothetical protein